MYTSGLKQPLDQSRVSKPSVLADLTVCIFNNFLCLSLVVWKL